MALYKSKLPLLNNLLAYYEFNNTVNDWTNRWNGIAHEVSYTDGIINKAFSGNGTSSWAELPDNFIKDYVKSYSCWIKTSSNGGILYYGEDMNPSGGLSNVYVPLLYVSDNILYSSIWLGSITQKTYSGISNGLWHHVAVNMGDNIFELWVDGVKSGTTSNLNPDHLTMNSNTIGVSWGLGLPSHYNDWYYFNGLIDEFSFYDITLTEDLVSMLYSNRNPRGIEKYGYMRYNTL